MDPRETPRLVRVELEVNPRFKQAWQSAASAGWDHRGVGIIEPVGTVGTITIVHDHDERTVRGMSYPSRVCSLRCWYRSADRSSKIMIQAGEGRRGSDHDVSVGSMH